MVDDYERSPEEDAVWGIDHLRAHGGVGEELGEGGGAGGEGGGAGEGSGAGEGGAE